MKKKTRQLKPDTVLKNYWSDNGRFADLFNAVLFSGEQRICPGELEDADTEQSTILENREYAQSIQAARDVINIQKVSGALGAQFVMYGLENQERIHYAMPMRVMGVDYAAYKKQYDANAGKYRDSRGMNEDEYLSKMKRADRLIPVITIVVYYGEKPWDGATSLCGMLDIPQWLEHAVSDYRMNLVEARVNTLKLQNTDNVDLFNLLEILLDKSSPLKEIKEKAIAYAEEHKVDKSVIMTVAGAANTRIDYKAFEIGDGKMYTVFEEIAKENESKGRIEGRIEGRLEGEAKGIIVVGFELGLSETEILEMLQKKLNVPKEKAQEYIEIFGRQTV